MRATLNENTRDELWFDRFYREQHGAVLAYARRRVEDADDVVAEVFAVAWQARDRIPDPPLPWLYRTAGNVVLHAHRSNGRRGRLATRAAATPEPTPDLADTVASRLDAGRRITAALQRLTPADQELLRLAAWEDLTPDEIAAVLDCAPGTARVRLHRARRRLAEALDRLEPRRPSILETRR